MLTGHIRVPKGDGSQVLDLQRNALRAAGFTPDQVYQDLSSGPSRDRLGGLIKNEGLREAGKYATLQWSAVPEISPKTVH